MEKYPYTPNSTIYPLKKFGSKFGLIIGSFILGALLVYFLFPREKTLEKIIDRPVDRIVEKPVDRIVEKPVEKIVEKIVEVPAKLTESQVVGSFIVGLINEAESRVLGINDTAVYPSSDKKIKVMVVGSDVSFKYISRSEITARVESIFRRNGFTVYNEAGPYCENLVIANNKVIIRYQVKD